MKGARLAWGTSNDVAWGQPLCLRGGTVNGRQQQMAGTVRDLNETEAEATCKARSQSSWRQVRGNRTLRSETYSPTFMEHKKQESRMKEKRFAVSTFKRYGLCGRSWLTPAFGTSKNTIYAGGICSMRMRSHHVRKRPEAADRWVDVRDLHDLTQTILIFRISARCHNSERGGVDPLPRNFQKHRSLEPSRSTKQRSRNFLRLRGTRHFAHCAAERKLTADPLVRSSSDHYESTPNPAQQGPRCAVD